MEDRGEGVALMFGVVPENSFRLLQVVIRRSRCHPHVPVDQRLQRWQLLALMGRTTDGVVPPPYGVRASVVCPWSWVWWLGVSQALRGFFVQDVRCQTRSAWPRVMDSLRIECLDAFIPGARLTSRRGEDAMTEGLSGSTVPRRQLGRYLRDLRGQARLTVRAAAGALEWS